MKTENNNDISLILKALKFSSEKHRSQKRKDEIGSPYINHPIQVAELLWNTGKVQDVSVIIAGLLHDTIEDTNTKADEIKTLFGEEVLNFVLEVTDDKTLPRDERKRLQVDHAHKKSDGAKQIKMADKISNIIDVTYSPPINWSLERKKEYLNWTENVMKGLRGVNPELEKLYDESLIKARKVLKIEE